MDEEEQAAADNFARNSAYSKKQDSYHTTLTPEEEKTFQAWVKNRNIPFDPSPTADYDMRGFFKGAQSGDPRASTAVNQNDGLMHFDDKWKTPYHKSFSNQSQYATPGAPAWNNQDQLVLPSGQVVFDERAPKAAVRAAPQQAPNMGALLQQLQAAMAGGQ